MRSPLAYFGALGGCAALAITAAVAADSPAKATPDKYSVQVPGGLAFAEFRGYESWSPIAISENHGLIAVIVGNPAAVDAYKSGVPGNGKPFPDGAKIAKIHWNPRKSETQPGQPTVPGTQHDVDFMVKDTKRFSDGGGWGYAYFVYDAPSASFSPATLADKPPQANDAKCGFACHSAMKAKDYVFTEYPTR